MSCSLRASNNHNQIRLQFLALQILQSHPRELRIQGPLVLQIIGVH